MRLLSLRRGLTLGARATAGAGLLLSLALAPASVRATPNGNASPHVAYNAIANEYLRVFVNNNGSLEWQVFGERVDADGVDVSGGSIAISAPATSGPQIYSSAVGYDPVNNRYLAAWVVNDGSGNYEVAGQLFTAGGTLLVPETLAEVGDYSGNFSIQSSLSSFRDSPAIAFDPVNQHYLVVWYDSRNGSYDIYGTLLGADGSVINEGFAISTEATYNQDKPRVAFDAVNERYLVVWQDVRNGVDNQIYGQLLDADGTLLVEGTLADAPDTTTNFKISDAGATGAESAPSVTFAPGDGTYLVVWTDTRDAAAQIYARRLDATATGQGDSFKISDVATTLYRLPDVVFDARSGQFVATFVGTTTDPDNYVYAQRIDEDGTPDGSNTILITETTYSLIEQKVATSPFCANHFSSSVIDISNVYTLLSGISAACAPDPGLLWPDAAVSPTTVVSGETATFSTQYWSASGTAPATAELWLDMDGDGEYTAPVVFSTVAGGPPNSTAPPSGPGGLAATGLSAAVGLAGMLLLTSLLAWRRPRWRPALMVSSVILGSSLVTTIAVIGCSSGDGSSTYLIGGTVTGLDGTVVLQNNGGDDLTLSESGVFTFVTRLADAAEYEVTVLEQPEDQECVVSNGSGTVAAAHVTDVAVDCGDEDTFGITVSGAGSLSIAEDGSDTFGIRLPFEPSADVTIALSSSDESEGTVSPATLTFTSSNWDTAQTVTITGVQDNVIDGDQTFNVVTGTLESGDSDYDGINPPNIQITTTDSGFQEVFTLTVDDAAAAAFQDGDFTNGETYSIDVPLSGDARTVSFKFVFSDGSNAAVGDPIAERPLEITAAP